MSRIVTCVATKTSVIVIFAHHDRKQEKVDLGEAANYQLSSPLGQAVQGFDVTFDADIPAAFITAAAGGDFLKHGDPYEIAVGDGHTQIGHCEGYVGSSLPPHLKELKKNLDGKLDEVTHAVGRVGAAASSIAGSSDESVTFPLMTQEVGYPPSPIANIGFGGGGMNGGSTFGAGMAAVKAISDVLGWKPKDNDPKAFVAALNASFTCKDFEGHAECVWTPRTYAVMADAAGGISGAQASLYSRAKDAVDRALVLLDGLYALRSDADPQDSESLKAIIKSQLTELVGELGLPSGPRVTRVDQLFFLLVNGLLNPQANQVQTDPDQVGGTLGTLREEFGLWTVTPPAGSNLLINRVDEEQNGTNYRILVDHVTSLRISWANNRQFFQRPVRTPFFGTQLVLLTRQLATVAESVGEVRFALDSVFIGPEERQILQIDFTANIVPPAHPTVPNPPNGASGQLADNAVNAGSMFVEEFLSWVERFAAEEGPRLIQDGGEFAVRNSLLPITIQLRNLIIAATPNNPVNNANLPQGYRSHRVIRALRELSQQLDSLAVLADPITHVIPSQV